MKRNGFIESMGGRTEKESQTGNMSSMRCMQIYESQELKTGHTCKYNLFGKWILLGFPWKITSACLFVSSLHQGAHLLPFNVEKNMLSPFVHFINVTWGQRIIQWREKGLWKEIKLSALWCSLSTSNNRYTGLIPSISWLVSWWVWKTVLKDNIYPLYPCSVWKHMNVGLWSTIAFSALSQI